MHYLAIQPTWETAIAHKRLKATQSNFQIQLMDGRLYQHLNRHM